MTSYDNPLYGAIRKMTPAEIAERDRVQRHMDQMTQDMYHGGLVKQGAIPAPLTATEIGMRIQEALAQKQHTQRAMTGMLTESLAHTLLAGRLRIGNGDVYPFAHLSFHIGPETVTLFVMGKGGPVILEDSASLFPSDDLIGKLQLLRG
ncbi:hypothetical protein EVB41_063 [Rhizobium phage RHph_TM3_14A]|nr:hypothetical protein EVB29_063 [Rhizobium phage RHph_TM27A]QIG66983.1 hypothetical protein EVB30_063 [Rhizobium phage RHph_TM27B]QIG67072.1 hypothetical protein EVB31_062 [Rhizobium phage RHph_TM29]QIG67528.1 hypothetical protein EVB41_063 [Rhizobium phage RHph_TM3_14A]